jgi:hypothetical protein
MKTNVLMKDRICLAVEANLVYSGPWYPIMNEYPKERREAKDARVR